MLKRPIQALTLFGKERGKVQLFKECIKGLDDFAFDSAVQIYEHALKILT